MNQAHVGDTQLTLPVIIFGYLQYVSASCYQTRLTYPIVE